MAKVLKTTFLSLFCLLASLLAGFFFVGCGVDYSKISLTPSQSDVVLDVGDSTEIIVTIENYDKDFSNLVKIYNSAPSAFEYSNLVYNNEKIRFTIVAKAGGNGTLMLETYEAGKTCSINVKVNQYSASMFDSNKTMYVSDSTNFVPDSSYFDFDSHTTNKEMSFYYIEQQSLDLSVYKLLRVENSKAYFSLMTDPLDVVEFDRVVMDSDSRLWLYLNGQNLGKEVVHTEITRTGIFKILSVYDYSLVLESEPIYCINQVYILPAIEMEVYGGYIDLNETVAGGAVNENFGYANFERLDLNDLDKITIVPNYKDKTEYVLRVETATVAGGSFLIFDKDQSNQNVIIDFYDYQEKDAAAVEGKTVRYFRISQNSQVQSNTTLSIKAYYDIAQEIEDEDVNVSFDLHIETKIAPTSMTVNGTTEPTRLKLYNYYKYPDFGWNELFVNVVSGYGASPNFDGVYFTFDSAYIDLMHNNTSVKSDDTDNLYTIEDLQESFYVRGVYGAPERSNLTITIHLLSDIWPEGQEMTVMIQCMITAGATQVSYERNYGENTYYYLDLDSGEVDFSQQIWADQGFQFFTYELIGGSDVLSLVQKDTPYIERSIGGANFYYLNFSIKPKATGVGIYRIYLDNGMPIELTFEVIKSLTKESTSFELAHEGNEAVTYFDVSQMTELGALHESLITLEILNASNKESVTFGSVAHLNVNANISEDVLFTPIDDTPIVGVVRDGDKSYKITTYERNGTREYDLTLKGYVVNEFFKRENAELNYGMKVISYSLAEDFYLKNGESYALSNIVYYGTNLREDSTARSVTFTPTLQNVESLGFYRYKFKDSSLPRMFNNAIENNGEYSYGVLSSDYTSEIVYEKYNPRYVSFEASEVTMVDAVVTKTSYPEGGEITTETRTVQLVFSNGLIFLPEYIDEYIETDQFGEIIATYSATFSSIYSISFYGTFDLDSFTYLNTRNDASYDLILKANVRQRNLQKRYDVKIESQKYKSVEGISLATNIEKIEFSNDQLTQVIGVYTYPTNSTNKDIRVRFVKSSQNEYSNMVSYDIDYSSKDNGVYTITLSAEQFVESLGAGVDVVDITTPLTGKLYIYPSEWGDDYSSIDDEYRPICIDVQFRNGSRANPYLIETAEDLMKINTNETTLSSHYEIKSVIDVTHVKDFVPIGILKNGENYEVKGFSGSIVGTTSHSAISNVVISQNNFYKVVNGVGYGGLFAQINNEQVYSNSDGTVYQTAIENLSVSGKFSLDMSCTNESYVGLLAAVNNGVLTNVGVKISSSEISTAGKLYYGGLVGINYGKITQDFTKYAGEGYTLALDGSGDDLFGEPVLKEVFEGSTNFTLSSIFNKYAGQTSKNLAYYNGVVNISTQNAIVVAGGIVGGSNGIVATIRSDKIKNYGYSGYAAYSQISISGQTSAANVYVGGAIGSASYAGIYLPAGTKTYKNLTKDLIVGGELSTEKLALTGSAKDAVGGIVGISETYGVVGNSVQILNNTSRTFVRAYNYAGGISGFDGYASAAGYDTYTDFGTTNKIQAVDDGRNSFYCAAIIKFNNDAAVTNFLTNAVKLDLYAIGNRLVNSRSYGVFAAESYLDRDLIVVPNGGKEINLANMTGAEKFGDYIVYDSNSSTIKTVFEFEKKEVKLEYESVSPYQMTGIAGSTDMFFVYYFGVDSFANGSIDLNVQDGVVNDLNFLSTSSNLYPFSLVDTDVNISASSTERLIVDINGNLTLKGVGLAEMRLTSILNIVETKVIYLYIVNYFDKDVDASLFYTSANYNGMNVTSNSTISVYGNSSTSINLVPTYEFESEDFDIEENKGFKITKEGVLRYNNMEFNLSDNSQLTTETENLSASPFSAVQVNKQTLVFYKKDMLAAGGEKDQYSLKPVLKISVNQDGTVYDYYYYLTGAEVEVDVEYKQTATAIEFAYNYYSMKTNEYFEDSVTIVSDNDDEHLFYQIFDKNGVLVQERMPEFIADVESFDESEYNVSENDLFKFEIESNGDNTFDYKFSVNVEGVPFASRFENDIYGQYYVHFYANELTSGVTNSFTVLLEEAEVNYLSIVNYSNINDFSSADNVLVPSQRGMLEITIDPIEAFVDEIVISNKLQNYQAGASTAILSFAYEKVAETGVEYIVDTNFGKYENGEFRFDFVDMLERFDALNAEFEKNGENSSVSYTGKIFVSYYMMASNVENNVDVGFDVEVKHSQTKSVKASIILTTKLNSYAKLVFADKTDLGGNYYVARGLSYELNLQAYGFSEDQVTITSSNSHIANVVKNGNGSYTLNITKNTIAYNGGLGYFVTIETYATKVVDNVTIETRDTIGIYVMEYVMNYYYQEGVNEDVVRGMENGVISVAIGNPHSLEFAIRQFLEYDEKSANVNEEVDLFVKQMTSNIKWTVYYNGSQEILGQGKTIENEYFKIDGLVVTPMRLYDPEMDIYHFSASANYKMQNGVYIYDSGSLESSLLYTEFAFDVHDQSTEDSPLPITNYEELTKMADGEWYILLNDIILPSSEHAVTNGVEEFKPLDANIAGLDGNGYKFLMSGSYNFADLTEIGLFTKVDADSIIKNVTIQLYQTYGDTIFKTNVSTFNAGLLAASNEGVISNCLVDSNGMSLSVKCAESTTGSYVAGLVASNSGFITHSRSKLNIMSKVNLSGFVGVNSGHIASSCFLGGSLTNETNTTTEYTAGFVVENSGDIYTSYVSGLPEPDKIYYSGTESTIRSSNSITGFVYKNSGNVFDCYTNIHLKQSGAFASGFVFENEGLIERAFSTSVLEGKQDSSYGFARLNVANQGVLTDCYYLSDVSEDINVSIGEINTDANTDIVVLAIDDFANIETYFSDFVVTEGRNINSVWFFNNNPDNWANGFGGQRFNTGRIELVAPNIVATSRRVFDHIENVVDPETGATYVKYKYIYSSTAPALGSQYNPILIASAEDMEEYILQENNSADCNYAHYRLIRDINYQDYLYTSKLYETRFRGYFEGNFMDVTNTPLISSESMVSAGLFAEISKVNTNADSVGAVMNFNFRPVTVSFANTNLVGAVAGKLDGGTIVNINIELLGTDSLIVVGNNIVGGAIGLATGNYYMQNVYSQLGAKARYQRLANLTESENEYDSTSTHYAENSFAGSMVGVLSGRGLIYNCHTDVVVSVLADKVGLMFGLVDSNATAKKIVVDMDQNMLINPYAYGGFVAGESRGRLIDVAVNGFGNNYTNFKQVPFVAKAVGGVVGLLSGGLIENVEMTQSIQVSSSNANSAISSLGGIAGEITQGAVVSNVKVEASLVGFAYVGGAAGIVHANTTFEDIEISNTSLAVYGSRVVEVAVGGLVAKTVDDGSVELKKSYLERNLLEVVVSGNIYLYTQDVCVYVGSVVGVSVNSKTNTVSYADCSIEGSISTLDMALAKPTTISSTISFKEGSTAGTVVFDDSKQDTTIQGYSRLTAVNTEVYCNVTYTCYTQALTDGGNKEYDMYVVLYGDSVLREE